MVTQEHFIQTTTVKESTFSGLTNSRGNLILGFMFVTKVSRCGGRRVGERESGVT